MQRIIKRKRFSLDNLLKNDRSYKGGLKIDYRITMVKVDGEDRYSLLTPINNDWNRVKVNIKVKGQVEMRPSFTNPKILQEISEATQTKLDYWGGYSTSYDTLWGNRLNKRVREEIRSLTINDVTRYLKLLGIQTERWSDGITIGTISWEK